LLGELGTAELFVLSSLRLDQLAAALQSHCLLIPVRALDTARLWVSTVPASAGSACLH
jgi:hypothetical protein